MTCWVIILAYIMHCKQIETIYHINIINHVHPLFLWEQQAYNKLGGPPDPIGYPIPSLHPHFPYLMDMFHGPLRHRHTRNLHRRDAFLFPHTITTITSSTHGCCTWWMLTLPLFKARRSEMAVSEDGVRGVHGMPIKCP